MRSYLLIGVVALALTAAAALLVGCAGMRGLAPLSSACRDRINGCLAQCSPGDARPEQLEGDSRSPCEQRCQDLCTR